MYKKLLLCIFFILLFQITKAQNEFITIWKPQDTQQIQFPGRGTNFQVYWEEIGYPQHNGMMNNVTSTVEFLINLGTPLNPSPAQATYRIKISDGNGSFDQVRFFDNTIIPNYNGPHRSKIIQITQWGNIKWKSFDNAFVYCDSMDMTATDAPDLRLVTSMRQMFYLCSTLVGNTSFNTWNTSTVTDMYYMFGDTNLFNQPLGNWNTSNVTDMSYMFDNTAFNQPLSGWNTSKVITMEHMFHEARNFNQDLKGWDTSKVTNMNEIFHDTVFNQNIGRWDLRSLVTATNMFLNSSMSCQNYDKTLAEWSQNAVTPNNINISSAYPLIYSNTAAVSARNNLINNKGWTISGDTYNASCNLSISEADTRNKASIYPNPVKDIIMLKNMPEATHYKITDMSGRTVTKDPLKNDEIPVRFLTPGNYILQIITKNKIHTLPFIRK
ncbi:BspA family leucine-rich repeat surface protein [Chryseobacterium sp. MEBOG06]|uniref:BspA family leucine-rich repeat surface protein n=1 Tax=Chryseobacterium sp. MEBOG06 TaxID=2879938 RepID=UPI001F1D259C|nr:BspA family leucine-rich repeat surface protein [Chryseobacterium sp. MEBOG06]UKB82702.1 BspA family leucine-rich repeat surface protein [Chryseobacterium sp. MEBOG06]